MELSRWGFAKLTQISDRYRDFSQFLAEVLEGDRSLIAETQKDRRSAFAVRDDIESLLGESAPQRSHYPHRETKLDGACFFRLAPFFEAGFMLRTSESYSAHAISKASVVSLQSMFLFGKVFLPQVNEAPNLELSLPTFLQGHIYRGRIDPVLRVFRLETLSSLKSADAFAFAPRDGLVFLLICNRPHPWQVSALEASYRSCQEIAHRVEARLRKATASE